LFKRRIASTTTFDPGSFYNRAVPSRLIINADDFGLTSGINRAILQLHRAGVLSSATLMANGPAFAEAVTLSSTAPNLGVGCHIVFVDGTPISPPETIPTLLGPDGRSFRPALLDFVRAVLSRKISAAELAREAEAQIQKLQQAGIDVTHIDTHKHIHVFPFVTGVVADSAARCGVGALRNPFEPAWSSGLARAPLLRRMQMIILNRFQPAFNLITLEIKKKALIPVGTIGIAATGTLTAETLRRTLNALPSSGTYELCCHPGHPDAALDGQKTRLRASREIEYHALLQVIPKILRTPGAPQLIHYGNLGIPVLQRVSG
jgi:predicted glycoside hydrolase/deacetylase ChbG (UPF0249 family)